MNLRSLVFTLLIIFNIPALLLPGTRNSWENYTDLKSVVSVSVSSQNIAFCATTGGLYVVNMSNGQVLRKYTNIDGLINVNLTATIIDKYNRIWIGASDGSISILDYNQNTWKYIYDIKNSNETNKIIYGFASYNDNIFVATGYGIQRISVSNLNFIDAPYYQLGNFNQKTKVLGLTILDNYLYAGTVSGIAYAYLVNTNLNNPATWTNYSTFPLNMNVRAVEAFDGKMFAGSDSGLVYKSGNAWYTYPNPTVSSSTIKSIKGIGNKIYFISFDKVYYSDKNNLASIAQFGNSASYTTLASDNSGNPVAGIFENGILAGVGGTLTNIFPNCPYRNSFAHLSEDADGAIWCSGGLGDAGFYRFDGSNWTAINKASNPSIGSSNDFRKVIIGNNMKFALSYGGGAVKISDGTYRNYNTQNSNLPGSDNGNGQNYCTPYGGAFDNNGIFWCSFYATNNSTYMYAYTGNDSVWVPFAKPSQITSGTPMQAIAIDNYNTKWIVGGGNGGGIAFFNENGNIGNPGNYIFGYYTLSSFESNEVKYVIVEKNNEVWIATSNGIYIISNPLAAIINPAQKPAPVKLGIISGNLKVPFTENCNSISVDVLNHKWIATENSGVFHLSEDGSTLIEQFNKTNSPILDNKINSIVVSVRTGRAYFGTLNGLSSVLTTAIQPVDNFDKIICSPNPYLLPPKGDLHIDGLVENSSVKILTISGELVAEFQSPGGRIASWNGLDKKGNYVSSGIYIVVGFNKDGSKVGKGKVAIIRR